MDRNLKGAISAMRGAVREGSLAAAPAAARSGWAQGAGRRTGRAVCIQSQRGEAWRAAAAATLSSRQRYVEVACRQMVGVMLGIYCRPALAAAGVVRVDHCESCGVGLLGAAGNKVGGRGSREPRMLTGAVRCKSERAGQIRQMGQIR
jgi:hypothetical protein